MFLTEDEVFVR